ncbi:MAG: bifunctional phosphopantothenoylcysteine decarboxylase/phosphopantothenate--cysteine ligase CoaBC [Eggerthellaceae bacterium]|jgi:phosphopantothenoylcysteine decarboxylase/phosphopantothenate--cysteine ligase
MGHKKTVVLGVTGCIAAYKSCEILRALQKRDIRVKVVMTEHATEFVGPTTFRALTHEPVAVGLFDDPSDPIHHISLAQEADVFLIAPCTANVMAKIAHGLADDLLSTAALATTAPVVLAPAMNVHMYENQATQENMKTLRDRGFRFVEPDAGYLACGDVGKGRLAEPEVIADAVCGILSHATDLAGKRVLITAGPTEEPIDPVRYISNRSSGKMGYALADAAAARGAHVTLVSGPVSLDVPVGVERVSVQTAQDMYDACDRVFDEVDLAIFAAAVADLRPAHPANRKMKKGQDDQLLGNIELVENPDILAMMGERKKNQLVVGFAAETDDVVANGLRKLASKHADMIVANQVGHGLAFGTSGDEAWLLTEQGNEHLPFMDKRALADVILDKSLELMG